MRISPEHTGIVMKDVSGRIRKLEAWGHRMRERRAVADPGVRVFSQVQFAEEMVRVVMRQGAHDFPVSLVSLHSCLRSRSHSTDTSV